MRRRDDFHAIRGGISSSSNSSVAHGSHDSRSFVEVTLDNQSCPTYDSLKAGSIDGTDTQPHDRAVSRALEAHYDPSTDTKIKGNKFTTLFVARLNLSTDERKLESFFERWGPLEHVRLVRDIITGCSKGYAFVTFRNESDFRRAWKEAHRAQLEGATLLVEYERERTVSGWIPRRFGGGIGGRKESGQLRFGGRDRPFKRPLTMLSTDTSQTLADREPETLSKMGVVMRVIQSDGDQQLSQVLHVKSAGRSTYSALIS